MADTGEAGEIKQRANAREAEAVREANELRHKIREGLPAPVKAKAHKHTDSPAPADDPTAH